VDEDGVIEGTAEVISTAAPAEEDEAAAAPTEDAEENQEAPAPKAQDAQA